MDLIDDEGDFIDAAVKVFEEIFQRFDVDKDGALNDAELDAFAIVNNVKFYSLIFRLVMENHFQKIQKLNCALTSIQTKARTSLAEDSSKCTSRKQALILRKLGMILAN